jgi:Ser/Thr protein kinase RdoA (MazF antagonist)
VGKDLCPPAVVAVHVEGSLLDPVAQRVTQMLLAPVRPGEQRKRRLLVEVLELLGAETAALGEGARDAQLCSLPFAKELSDPF